ncbi:hypothetical protein K402DRAFT_406693 [Aulographum hederae CBS 113979]|uniref:Calcium permease family membrane transporter n=1 Tax=Aulographum hederae CBS 113979 TaxID=1176131 RepID=A0A6G1GRU8_9PEZI|nr:hypothetical protein K402DRAFT_406693 [Aulographum hederae CBS 113979]
MADENPSPSGAGPTDQSAASTRRGSAISAGNNEYGTASQSSSTGATRRRPPPIHPHTEGYGSITNPLHSARSPDATRGSSRRPGGLSRRSTSTHGPHRGQEFSVDDAEDEIEVEPPPRQSKKPPGSLRKMPSSLRRRPAAQTPALPRVASNDDDNDPNDAMEAEHAGAPTEGQEGPSSEDRTIRAEEEEQEEEVEQEEPDEDSGDVIDDDEEELSDAESFTLRDRQQAINVTHPFGIRIWKPALYKKDRSVQKSAEEEIRSSPGGRVSTWLLIFNFLWTILFGWWLALLAFTGSLLCLSLGFTSRGCVEYGKILLGLSRYVFYPFGKFVKLMQDDAYMEEDEGEGRSISEYEQWQSGDLEEGRLFFGPLHINRSLVGRRRNSVDSTDETQSLLGRTGGRGSNGQDQAAKSKRRLFGRGQWNLGRVIFFVFFYFLISPCLLLVSGICWLLVFSIPMGKVTLLLFDHLRRHPLALSFHSDSSESRSPGEVHSSVLLCTYRAVGSKYWKYTIDGTNIFLINLLAVTAFAIFDYFILFEVLELEIAITSPFFMFCLGLLSIVPLAYFIGQAVASISAQSSMGVGATLNAFFSTVVEVFLYCVALNQGKAQLVEGSIIGSIFAGILFLPGLSMCFGALKRKTQRFNVKSAGVTSTMLLFAVIACFGPTLFYQIYGSSELNCTQCTEQDDDANKFDRDCRRCYIVQTPAVHDKFYTDAVQPYIYFASVLLFLSYVIGLLFTLRTHAAVIWASELDEKKAEHSNMTQSIGAGSTGASSTGQATAGAPVSAPKADVRESQLYKRILGQSLKQAGFLPNGELHISKHRDSSNSGERPEGDGMHIPGMSESENDQFVRQVAEMAATAATVAARDTLKAPRRASQMAGTVSAKPIKEHVPSEHRNSDSRSDNRPSVTRTTTFAEPEDQAAAEAATGVVSGGHDAPNWSRTKSAVVLLTATVAYAVIAEILVNTVDTVLENVDIDEKFLGITLFALVPNTTEFLNAISFAMNGNIALSMEIGSAYALQVCLLQVPALVLFSAVHGRFINPEDIIDHTFTLIFPQWDMVTVILCVFLLSYMYGEGKSNYFKGSILILSYLVVIVGFYFSGFDNVQVVQYGGGRVGKFGGGPTGLKEETLRGLRGGEL